MSYIFHSNSERHLPLGVDASLYMRAYEAHVHTYSVQRYDKFATYTNFSTKKAQKFYIFTQKEPFREETAL